MRTFLLPLWAGAWIMAACVQGALFDITADGADQSLDSAGGTGWVGQPTIRVGRGSTLDTVMVMAFELPVLPAGESVGTANLKITLTGGNDWGSLQNRGIDLYGLRLDSSAAVQTTDFYTGPYGGDSGSTP